MSMPNMPFIECAAFNALHSNEIQNMVFVEEESIYPFRSFLDSIDENNLKFILDPDLIFSSTVSAEIPK